MAISMELLEPDEFSPVALPLDDIVRHGDDIADIYKAATHNPDSTFAVLGKYLKGDKNSYEVIGEIMGGSHLNLKNFDEFKDAFGEDSFWDLINKPYIQEITGKKKPVWLTEAYDNLDVIRGGLRDDVIMLAEDYGYKFKLGSHWLLPK